MHILFDQVLGFGILLEGELTFIFIEQPLVPLWRDEVKDALSLSRQLQTCQPSYHLEGFTDSWEFWVSSCVIGVGSGFNTF